MSSYKYLYNDFETNKIYYSKTKICTDIDQNYRLKDGDSGKIVTKNGQFLSEITKDSCASWQYCPTEEETGPNSDPKLLCIWGGSLQWSEMRCLNSKNQVSLCCNLPQDGKGGFVPPPSNPPSKKPDDPDCCCGGCPDDNPVEQDCKKEDQNKPNCFNCLYGAGTYNNESQCNKNCKLITFKPNDPTWLASNKVNKVVPEKVIKIFTDPELVSKPDMVSDFALNKEAWCVPKDYDVKTSPGPWCGHMNQNLARTVDNCNILDSKTSGTGCMIHLNRALNHDPDKHIQKVKNIEIRECCELAKSKNGKAMFSEVNGINDRTICDIYHKDSTMINAGPDSKTYVVQPGISDSPDASGGEYLAVDGAVQVRNSCTVRSVASTDPHGSLERCTIDTGANCFDPDSKPVDISQAEPSGGVPFLDTWYCMDPKTGKPINNSAQCWKSYFLNNGKIANWNDNGNPYPIQKDDAGNPLPDLPYQCQWHE